MFSVCEAAVSCYTCEYTLNAASPSGNSWCQDVSTYSSATTASSCTYCVVSHSLPCVTGLSYPLNWIESWYTCPFIMSQAMKNIKLLNCVIERGFIYELIFSTWLVHTCLYLYALMHSLTLIILASSAGIIVSEILTMVVDKKIKSWLGVFEILWWPNDMWPGPDELAKWQHLIWGISSRKIVKQCFQTELPWWTQKFGEVAEN